MTTCRYVDAIYAVLNSNPLFREVEVVLIIEPDSLPNLITNVDIPACAAAQKSGVYVEV
jgi:cellulose 1,4-beta-cellobiosidase